MSYPELVQPPASNTPPVSLHLSQQAPHVLQNSTKSSLPFPLSLLTSNETQETWITYENLLISLLRTGDDKSARQCLDRLIERFGERNERVMALTGMYEEAVADDGKAIVKVLKDYEDILTQDPTNMLIRKRHVALLRSTGKPHEATARLVELLEISPTDSEAWAELADLYFTQAMYAQAIYALEEVLLIVPNAWNMHARLAEVLYISATSSDSLDSRVRIKSLSESMRRFCRSMELCNNYLRGCYGLKMATKKLLDLLPTTAKNALAATDEDLPPPELARVEKLHELATSKLAEIVRRNSSGEQGWEGYDESEVIAARALLDKDGEIVER